MYTQVEPNELKNYCNSIKEEVNGVIRNVLYLQEGVFVKNHPLGQMTSNLLIPEPETKYEKPVWSNL